MPQIVNSPARVRLISRVDELNLPIQRFAMKVIDDHFLVIAERQDELPMTLGCERPHHVQQNRLARNGEHRLGQILRVWICSRSPAAAENDYLHGQPSDEVNSYRSIITQQR